MIRGTCAGLAACMLVAAGCAPGDLDGRLGFGEDIPPLQRVLVTSEDTPAYQGLLHVAMKEAEAAAQGAGQAVASANDPAEARSALGEVIYAVAPGVAPEWRAKGTGLIPGWAATGYGVRRAVREMAGELRAVDRGLGSEPERALVCAENTLRRAEELLELARRALDEEGTEQLDDLLPRIEDLALALNHGRDADGDDAIEVEEDECGLQGVQTVLEPLYVRRTAV